MPTPKKRSRASADPKSRAPVNVPGAARNRLRTVVEDKPDANYEIVHGVVMLQNPDNVGKRREDWFEPHQVAYYPGDVIRLAWSDAAPMLRRGVIVEVGEEPAIMTTNGDIIERPKGWERDEDADGVRRVRVDIETASKVLYDADSSLRGMGGLRAASAAR